MPTFFTYHAVHSWRSEVKKVIKKRKPKASPSDRFYSTVWLSDYESEFDKKSEAELFREDSLTSLSQRTTPHDSRITTPFSSQPTSPYSSQVSSPTSSRPTTPSNFYKFEDEDSGLPSETDKSYDDIVKPRKKLHRTLSLPDSELNHISSNDLHERFNALQLEQENRNLKKLTEDLQIALEKLEEKVNVMHEEKVNEIQKCDRDSLDEQPPKLLSLPVKQPRYTDIPLVSPLQDLQPTRQRKKKQDREKERKSRPKSKQHKKDHGSCCVS